MKKRSKARSPFGRDYVTLAEITHGSGTGYHPSKKGSLRKQARKDKQRGWAGQYAARSGGE